MKRPLLSLLLAIFASFTVFDAAEARRLGGGGGGMQRNITPSAPLSPAPKPTSPTSPTQAPAQRQAPAQQPSTAPQPAPKRSWLGPLAGLAAGLGLAALFHHLGLGEEFGSLLLLVLLAVVVIALFRRFAGARRAPEPAYAGATERTMTEPAMDAPAATPTNGAAPVADDLRAQLDEAAFLTEAKRRFIELQAAHNRGDWEAIASLVTPELLADLRRQGGQTPGEKTDIVLLDARLVDLTREDGHYVATVEFSGSLRESPDAPPQPFAEYWHLVKPEEGGGWRLAGIQPIA